MVVVSVVVVHALKNNASEKLTNPRKTYFQLKNTDGLLGIRSEAGLAIIIQLLTTKSLVPMRLLPRTLHQRALQSGWFFTSETQRA